MSARIGVCPECKQWERLFGDGTIGNHPPRSHDSPYDLCVGTRFAPLETMPLHDEVES